MDLTGLRAVTDRCTVRSVLALRADDLVDLGLHQLREHTDAGADGAVGDAWQNAYETVFVPGHDDWARRVEAIRGSDKGCRASEDQARRAEEFEQLIERFENESASVCELCGAAGALSRTVAQWPWYAVRCDGCREDDWILASQGR